MKKLLIVAAAVVLMGCSKDPESVTFKGAGFKVETLFTDEDGCTVKRFEDGGRDRYYTNCKGTTTYSESCGKNCTTESGVEGL